MKKVKFNPENWVHEELELVVYSDGDFVLWDERYRIIKTDGGVLAPDPQDRRQEKWHYDTYKVIRVDDGYQVCWGWRMYYESDAETEPYHFGLGEWIDYEREDQDITLAAAKVVANLA